MRFAYYISPRCRAPEQYAPLLDIGTEMTLQAEAAGFDAVFLTEHHISTHNPFQNSLQYGAYLAPQLKRMWVGLSTVIPTLWQPVRLVEQCNLLDQLTRGRCIIGVGPGSMPHEFDAFGREVAQRDELFQQTMDVLLKLWRLQPGDEPLEFETAAERGYVDRPVNPPPYRRPMPLLARATSTGGAIDECARLGWPLFVVPWEPLEMRDRLATYWHALENSKHPAEVIADCRRWTGTLKWIHVAETDAQAERDIDAVIERQMLEMKTHAHAPRPSQSQDQAAPEIARVRGFISAGNSPAERMKGLLALYGSPGTVIAKLRAYADAGVGTMMGMFVRDLDEVESARRSFQLFIDEVLPHVQSPTPAGSLT